MGKNNYILPAEWQPQDGVQLTWPHADTDWAPYLDDIIEVFVRLVSAIAKYEYVLVAAQDAVVVKSLLKRRIGAIAMSRVLVYQCENDDTWARDHAFITLVRPDGVGKDAAPRLLDFRFNGWGEKFPHSKDNVINRRLYDAGAFIGERIDCGDFVLEGGSIESDGCGTVFTTSQCLLASHRNQPLCREEIEQRLKDRLCAERIVWLDHGRLVGDDTDGHIDTIVRLAPNNTLLYVGCDDENDAQYLDLKLLERQLTALRTMGGTPYRLLQLPMPDAIYDEGERLPATYVNFLVINDAVIVPLYAQQKDAEAMKTIAMAFPEREIVGIDARCVIRQHGSLHCLTMQFPKGTMRLP